MDTPLQETGPTEAIRRAVEKVGGNAAMAAILGISRPAVAQWQQCPALRVLQVEALTGVSRHELRPDLYPVENVSHV